MPQRNALQTYIRELRIGRGISQDDFAYAIGLSCRAYFNWESGLTQGIKHVILFEAIGILGAALHHIYYVVHNPKGIDQAVVLAHSWLAEKDVLDSEDNSWMFKHIKADQKMQEVLHMIESLSHDASALDQLIGYVEGLIDQKRIR